MLLWDAAYYIYTLFGEFDFSLKIQVKHFTLDLYAEQFTEVRQTDWTCHSCTGCQRKVLFGAKVREAGEEAKFLFSKTIRLSPVF